MCCPANPAQKVNYWALHSADAAADAAACPAAVLAVGADAAAFAAIVDAAAVAAVGAGFCVQPSRLVLSSGAARRLELLLLPCRQARQLQGREGKGRAGQGREAKGSAGKGRAAFWRQFYDKLSTILRPQIKQNVNIHVVWYFTVWVSSQL